MVRSGESGPVAPSRDDPTLAAVSDGIGGPLGTRSAGHRWWTPVRIVLAMAAVCMALGIVQKAPCYAENWSGDSTRYTHMCYSDLPYLYTGRGLADRAWPYSDDATVRARHEVMEYPVGIAYFAYAAAWVTQIAVGSPDLELRRISDPGALWGTDEGRHEIMVFVAVNAVGFAALGLLAAWFLTGVNPRRPWDAAAFALSPVLALTALVNWDLLSVALVAAALWAWARERPVLTGLLIGLGTAAKLYPLFMLGALLIICWRDRRMRDFGAAVVAAVAAWVVADLPALLSSVDAWLHFWSFNSERGPDLGSIWLVIAQAGDLSISPDTVNRGSWAFFAIWCLGVLAIGVKAPVTPRFAQLALLITIGFLLINKVYSPQYVLWLLPLAVIARPRWSDLLWWQAAEVFYFAAVWWYLADLLAPGTGGDAATYWVAIVLRMVAELALAFRVVQDMYRPEQDPVRHAEKDPEPISSDQVAVS